MDVAVGVAEWVAEPEAVLELELLHAAASRARGTAAIAASVVRFMCFSSGFDCQRAGGRERDHGPGVQHVAGVDEIGLATASMRVYARVSSPEPAVGLYVPARTCQTKPV